ncbi:hypothetical protein [Fervidibacillus halotolerans]|uniref:Uncharacterized protein n=1 Tax=Fervidibacillus halotolerans TaxID=2980027 RepID=A0A9E8LYB5_9BACI|nr:hypothetical protein [Fervidibacillus halotolerans]WAA11993.1 hypothetical protein OE105_10435 [Fervidibacillus halotolerans]
MSIYKVEEDQIPLIPHDDEEVRTISYSPDGKDTYIFVRKRFYNYHLLFVHEGLKELLNRILEADSK